MRRAALLFPLLFASPLAAPADEPSSSFPAAVVALLDQESPQMDKAVAAQDRRYFGPALERVQGLLAEWQQREGPAVLDRHPACTDALTDFLIVGLCKILPPGSICEPATFFPKVERSIAQCRGMVAPQSAGK